MEELYDKDEKYEEFSSLEQDFVACNPEYCNLINDEEVYSLGLSKEDVNYNNIYYDLLTTKMISILTYKYPFLEEEKFNVYIDDNLSSFEYELPENSKEEYIDLLIEYREFDRDLVRINKLYFELEERKENINYPTENLKNLIIKYLRTNDNFVINKKDLQTLNQDCFEYLIDENYHLLEIPYDLVKEIIKENITFENEINKTRKGEER